MTRPFVRVLCLPDINRPIGGVKQLYRHAEHLVSLGWDAAVLTEAHDFRPTWFESTAKTISIFDSYSSGELRNSNTIVVVPETYCTADLTNVRGFDLSRVPRVIFNQNAYYTYSNLSPNSKTLSLVNSFYKDSHVLGVLAVSENTESFLSSNILIQDNHLFRIINAVENTFIPSTSKSKTFLWMPRKNPEHVNAILFALQNSPPPFSDGWIGHPLDNISHTEVAQALNSGSIFLSFGHPEGFGLPVAEAMASGCWVVGYTGLGGSELFRFGGSTAVEFSDWQSFYYSLSRVFHLFSNHPNQVSRLLSRQSETVRFLYSHAMERQSISDTWSSILRNHDILVSSL